MRKVATLLSLVMLAQANLAFAQQPAPLAPAANKPGPFGSGLVPIITPNPGQYDMLDTSEYTRDLLKQIQGVQQIDIDYVDKVIASVTDSVNEYTRLLTSGDYKQLSDMTVSGRTSADGTVVNGKIQVGRFLDVQNQIVLAKQNLQNKLALLTSASGALPSDAVIGEGRTQQAIVAPRRIDFSKTINAANDAIKTAEAVTLTYKFVIEHPQGVQIINPNSGQPLNVVLDFPLLTNDAIRDLQAKARKLSIPSARFDDELTEDHATLVKKQIAQFVFAYGDKEAYRFRDQALSDARAEALSKIIDLFWQRSYLRKVSGVRVGVILPAYYNKRYVGIDKFTVLMDQLKTFQEASGPTQVTDAQLGQSTEDVRQTLIVLDERSSKIMSGDATVLARVNSFITYIKGERPTAEALLLIMQLVAADLKEEYELAIGGGLPAVTALYNQRWLATEADGLAVDARVCAYDHIFNNQENKTNCYLGGASGGIKGVFTEMNDELNIQYANIQQAMEIRKQVQIGMLSQAMSKGGANAVPNRRGR